ncbi:hypothetical protein DFH09DRAFT_1336844 [Mycena vulgaris]|nr:hypothetical protein DFH09DRAFT_1336844 [Mycena vulgaris]
MDVWVHCAALWMRVAARDDFSLHVRLAHAAFVSAGSYPWCTPPTHDAPLPASRDSTASSPDAVPLSLLRSPFVLSLVLFSSVLAICPRALPTLPTTSALYARAVRLGVPRKINARRALPRHLLLTSVTEAIGYARILAYHTHVIFPPP